MASLGEATVGLRAETAQFQSGIAGASSSLADLRLHLQRTIEKIRELQDDWQHARIGDSELVQGIRVLQTEADRTRSAMVALGGGVEQVATRTAANAGVGLGRLRYSFSTLAAELTGVPPIAARVASSIGVMGAGMPVTLGVLAGIAAIAEGWRLMTEHGRKVAEAIKSVDDAVAHLNQTQLGTAIADRARAGELQKATQAQIGDLAGLRTSDPQKFIEFGGESRLRSLQAELNDLNVSYVRATGVVTALRTAFETDWVKKHTEAVHQHGIEVGNDNRAIDSLLKSFKAWKASLSDPILFTQSGVLGLSKGTTTLDLQRSFKGLGPTGKQIEADINETIRTLPDNLIPKLPVGPYAELGKRLGKYIGDGMSRQLAVAIVEGTKSLGDALKQAFNRALEEVLAAIIKSLILKKIADAIKKALSSEVSGGGGLFGTLFGVIGGVLGGPVGAGIGTAIGGALGGSVGGSVGGTGPNGWGGDATAAGLRAAPTIIVPTSRIPPNPSPIAMARDAQHQALWAETARVLETQGVRLRLA